MLESVSRRLLTLVQLTRMALVFTAISNSLCALMLWSRWNTADDASLRDYLTWPHALCVAGASIGLYGFGMCLNDIIDRRRDLQLAAHRPLPSGQIGVATAHLVCASLAVLAIACGIGITQFESADSLSLVLVIWTGMLIAFYDFAAKYLVGPGLLTLGLIRFFHAAIAAPRLPLVWHPLLLLNHVTIISLIAYAWEDKRPVLTRAHWWAVLSGLGAIDLLCVGLIGFRRRQFLHGSGGILDALWITRGLILPGLAVVAFLIVSFRIWRLYVSAKSSPSDREATAGNTVVNRRRAGQTLMLYGLLWLIVYDAAFALAYVNWLAALMLIGLLPLAYLCVRMTRWWGRMISLSQRLDFQRIR